jgi:glycosyltransferase involved in cell wall biosynthesis
MARPEARIPAGEVGSGRGLRVLLVNFQMDPASQVLGWQERVAVGLAHRCRSVVALTERAVPAPRPANLRIVTVPRWMQRPWRLLGARWLMNGPVARLARDADVCFVHMAADWTYRLFPALRARRVPIVVWYAHGTVSTRLRLALRCADRVLTSSPEGFRIASPKVRVIGQGVDAATFRLLPPPALASRLVTVGRLSPRKRLDVLLHALAEARRDPRGRDLTLRVVGGPVARGDRRHVAALHAEVRRLGLGDAVEFTGPLPPADVVRAHADAFLHVNVSATGSMDKTVLEALACGRPVLTANEAFRDLLRDQPALLLDRLEPRLLAARILTLRAAAPRYTPEAMRAKVAGRNDLDGYLDRVAGHLHDVAGLA